MPSKDSGGIRSRLVSGVLWPIAFLLKAREPHSTIDRFFESQHVRDLQVIVAASIFPIELGFLGGLAYVIHSGFSWSLVGSFLKYYGPMLAVFGTVLSWAYKTGSARLGVVDLFASEISTLCRVTMLVDAVGRSVDKFRNPPAPHDGAVKPHTHGVQQFTSGENYFPVFESNNKALETLEANVVINITAFYTYMKAFRDSLRALAELGPAVAEVHDEAAIYGWTTAARNSVYMLFLSLESGHKAIADLVEFEPEQAERLIVILLSELDAFRFLRSQFQSQDDVYHLRLELRVAEYEKTVCDLIDQVRTGDKGATETDWEPARLLIPELRKRFGDAVSTSLAARAGA